MSDSTPMALATSIYFSWVLLIHIPQCYKQYLFVKKGLNNKRFKVFSLIPIPALKPWSFVGLNLIFCTSLLLIVISPETKLFMGLALISYFLYFGQILEMANIRKKTNIIPLILLILLLSPTTTDAQSQTYRITVFLLQLSVVQMYVGSGFQKLRTSGLRWADGKTLQTTCLHYYAWSGNQLAHSVGQNLPLCRVLSIGTLLFECTFWLIFLFPELTIPYVAIGFLFHLGTSLALKINYIYYFIPAYIWLLIDYLGSVYKVL